MLNYRKVIFTAIVLSFFIHRIGAMIEDSRFFPLYPRNYSRTWCTPSAQFFDGFLMTGNDAFNEDNEQELGIFDIFGLYDENKVADALIAVGVPDPFSDFLSLQRFKGQEIIWKMDGKIQTQGLSYQWDQHIWGNFWFGGSLFFMHLYSRNNFELSMKSINALKVTTEDILRLDQLRRLMNIQLNLEPSVYNRTAFSDIDLYIRGGNILDYFCKFRRIDAGLKFGCMIPSGLKRKIINPAAVPFGGDGHWGIYTAGDIEFELKEDWKLGGHFRINKRFKKTKTERMPVAGEQQLYGAVQGLASIDPGFTFIFAPYARLENIREGFGLQAGYTAAHHMKDRWKDERENPTIPVQLEVIEKKSRWTSEYITVDAFYDCATLRLPYEFAPICSFRWDVPIRLFVAEDAVKTNRITLGIGYLY